MTRRNRFGHRDRRVPAMDVAEGQLLHLESSRCLCGIGHFDVEYSIPGINPEVAVALAG